MRKIKILIVTTLVGIFGFGNNFCFAEDDGYDFMKLFVEDRFIDDRDACEYIDKKIEDDLESKTGIVNEKLEEKLNSCGYFDEDIERLDEHDIASLDGTDLDNITVLTEYYAIPDTKDNEIMIKLTSNEVDELIASKYYGKDVDMDSVVYERVKDEYLKGAEKYAYIKKSLILSKTDIYYHTTDDEKENFYQLIESLTFVVMPASRGIDEYKINLTNIEYEMADPGVWDDLREQGHDLEYIATSVSKVYDEEKYLISKKEKENYTLTKNIKEEQTDIRKVDNREAQLSNGQYEVNRTNLAGVNDLLDDKVHDTKEGKEYTNYYNETIKVRLYLIPMYELSDRVYISEEYKHSVKEAKKEGILENKFFYAGMATVIIVMVAIIILCKKKKTK